MQIDHLPEYQKGVAGRCVWLDLSRMIAILFVMIAHSPLAFRGNATMASTPVALFFLLSGYFDKPCSTKKRISRVLSFLVAFVVWFTAGFGCTHLSTLRHLSAWFYFSGHLWFLIYLIPCIILNAIYLKLRTLYKVSLLMGVISASTYLRIHFHVMWDHPLIPLLYALSMYWVGVILRKYYSTEKLHEVLFLSHSKLRFIVCVLSVGVFIAFLYLADHRVRIPYCPLYYLIGCWGILGMCYYARCYLPRLSHTLVAAAPGTFFVYVSHQLIARNLTSLANVMGIPSNSSILHWGIIFITFCLGALVCRFLRNKNILINIIFFGRCSLRS